MVVNTPIILLYFYSSEYRSSGKGKWDWEYTSDFPAEMGRRMQKIWTWFGGKRQYNSKMQSRIWFTYERKKQTRENSTGKIFL